jgi:hypothetical protein
MFLAAATAFAAVSLVAAGDEDVSGTASSPAEDEDSGSIVSADRSPAYKDGPSRTELLKTPEGYRLYWNQRPFWINGAGGHTYLSELTQAGGNTIRLWGSDGADKHLDAAWSNGLAVCVGLWMKHERHGMKYDDPKQVELQLKKIRSAVQKYKDHPAVLMWGAGNEVEWQPGTNVLVYKAINDVAKTIKAIDTNHPVMCTLADLGVNNFKVGMMQKYCPDVDILGVNSYGGLRTLPDRLRNAGWKKPYVVTEYGPKGPWEMPRMPWGAPTEQTTSEKARFAYDSYKLGIQADTNWCLGGFVFRWGFKMEVTPTWFSMFHTDNTHYALVDYMQYVWTGHWPSNRAPDIVSLDSAIARKRVAMADTYFATISAADPDNDALSYRWDLVRETNKKNKTGGWDTQQFKVPKGILSTNGTRVTIRPAAGVGGYRLFVYVTDGKGNAASANFPFEVVNAESLPAAKAPTNTAAAVKAVKKP